MKKLLSLMLLCMVCMGASAQGTKLYKPTTRATSITSGTKYMIFNTCFNGNEDRTGFLYASGNDMGHSGAPKIYPSRNPVFVPNYVWTATSLTNDCEFSLQNVGTSKYANASGNVGNADAQSLYIQEWTVSQCPKAGVNSWTAPDNVTANASITTSNCVYTVCGTSKSSNGQSNGNGDIWNGNPNSFAKWNPGHPFAFYEVQEVETVDASHISSNKAYVLSCNRSVLGADATHLVRATSKNLAEDAFAFVTYEEKTYMWSLRAQAFVKNDGTFTHNVSELTNSLVTFDNDANGSVKVHIGSNTINDNGQGAISVNNYNTSDDGNRFGINEVDDFDDSEPMEYLTGSKIVVTYHVANAYDEDYVVTDFLSNGATATAPTFEYFSNATITEDNKVVSSENNEFHITGTWSFPVQDGKYYTMKAASNSGNFVAHGTDYAICNNQVAAAAGNDVWSFEHVEGTINLYKLKNFKYGYATAANADNQVVLTFADAATSWTSGTGATSYFRITKNGDGFNISHPGNNQANAGDHVSHKFGFWTNSGSLTSANNRMSVAETEAPARDWDEFQTLYNQLAAYSIGTKLGEYSTTLYGYPLNASQFDTCKDIWKETFDNKEEGNYVTNTNEMNEALTNMILNMPQEGQFIRIHGYDDASSKYLQGTVNGNNQLTVGDKNNTTLFCYTDGKLVAYTNGQYVANNSSNKATLAEVGGTAAAVEFREDTANRGLAIYNVRIAGWTQWIGSSATQSDCSSGWRDGQGWRLQIEEAEELPVALTQVGELAYASFNAPVAVKVADGVTAYKATINGDVLELTAFEGTNLAANTPVILTAETEGTYNFNIVASGEAFASDLQGTVAKQNVAAGMTTYVLNKKEGKIGFYTSENFINGFKAYCETETTTGSVQKFSFNFNEEMTTAIRAIESENSGAEIFDAAGNRLKKAQKGMNIINGMKVLVK